MAVLTVQRVVLAGLKPTFVEPGATGDTFVNSGRVFIFVKNGTASTIDVTIDSVAPCSQGYDHDAEVAAIPASENRMVGPFPQSRFNDEASSAKVTCTVQTLVEIAAIEVP